MNKNLGNRIKLFRTKNKLSREELSDKLEVSIHTLIKYEQGQREPNLEMINKIAAALNVSANDLLTDDNTIDINSIPRDGVDLLYANGLIALADIFKNLGYKLTENESVLNIFNGNDLIVSIPENDFIEIGKKTLEHINEFSEFEINKLIDTFRILE